MNTQERLMMMLAQTANALGPDLISKTAFVGREGRQGSCSDRHCSPLLPMAFQRIPIAEIWPAGSRGTSLMR